MSVDSPRERQSEPGPLSGRPSAIRTPEGLAIDASHTAMPSSPIRIAIGWSASPSRPPPEPSPSAADNGARDHPASQGSFSQVEAAVLDISRPGLSIIVASLPPSDRQLWVGIKGGDPTTWSGVILRSLSEPRPGEFVLRLSFINTCPYDLFKYVVLQP